MPKDPKKNVDRFKVRGGEINEFDYAHNQEQLAEATKRGQRQRSGKMGSKGTKTSKRQTKSRKKAG